MYWTLRNNAALQAAAIDPLQLAREAQALTVQFPTAAVNVEEQRRLRSALYKPLIRLSADKRAEIVEQVMTLLVGEGAA